MAIIYLITNNVNSKQYIGASTRSFDERWNEHVKAARLGSDSYLHRAIRKHGESSFKHEVLEECEDDLVLTRERVWIAKKATFAPNGYNLTRGGDGILGFKHSPESIERNRGAHIARTQSSVTCDKKRRSMKASQRVSREPVLMIDGDSVQCFESVSAAARAIGKPPSAATLISRCCRGKTSTAYGHKWKYVNAVEPSEERQKAVVRSVEKRDMSGRLLETYVSLAEANRSLNKTSPAIRLCCHGKLHTAYGYKWNFVSSPPKISSVKVV